MGTEDSSALSPLPAESGSRLFNREPPSPDPADAAYAGQLPDDACLVRALITAEVALTRAWAVAGIAPAEVADEISAVFGWNEEAGSDGAYSMTDRELVWLTDQAVVAGNPVMPLVEILRSQVSEGAKQWIHRGIDAEDVLDTALMLIGHEVALDVLVLLVEIDETLLGFAAEHRDIAAATHPLTQHAAPTTVGARAAAWERGIARAAVKIDDLMWELPAQLGGAGGTLAAIARIGGEEVAKALPALFADELSLAAPDGPWRAIRFPITELSDVLVQVVDALGIIATDIATLSRAEIGEFTAGDNADSVMQQQNARRAALIRSAVMRAPHLSASLHTAAALTTSERPDSTWHTEWPVLRELLCLTCDAARTAAKLVNTLAVHRVAIDRNLTLMGRSIVAERLTRELGPIIGVDRVWEIIGAASPDRPLAELLSTDRMLAAAGYNAEKIAELVYSANDVGLATHFVDELTVVDDRTRCPVGEGQSVRDSQSVRDGQPGEPGEPDGSGEPGGASLEEQASLP